MENEALRKEYILRYMLIKLNKEYYSFIPIFNKF